jgi:hypothetical protein
LIAFGVIWSEVIDWDKDGLDPEVVPAPSLDRGDMIKSDLPDVVDAE